ncbi:hypothetical protein BDV93DRAFT_543319 [Ceratobasidium sp. AG-I]|nr:hypothetical protein BDV93DRAFT_543319 [Ceratobasidium sp. AG-I]
MLNRVGEDDDNRSGMSTAVRVRKAEAVRLSSKAAGCKKSSSKTNGQMNPRHLKSGYIDAASVGADAPELVRDPESVDNTPLVTPTDVKFEVIPQMNDAKTGFGGSNFRNEVAHRPSILTDSNISGYILRRRNELHCGKLIRSYANEGKENRPPTHQTLCPITDFPSPPPAPRIDSGAFDFHYALPHSEISNPDTNTSTELNLDRDLFVDLSSQHKPKDDKNTSPQFISTEPERPLTELGLDVAHRNEAPPPEECEPAKESALITMDYPRAPRPDMGDWSADLIDEAVISAPVLADLCHAKRSESESAFSLASSVAQSREPRVGTGTGDRSFGWDTGLGLTLDMIADADAEFSGMNLSLGDTSVDNSLSLYTPESSFFHSSNGVIEESTVGLFPRMLGAGARLCLEQEAPTTIVPVEDKLLGLGLASSPRRAAGAWSWSSAAAEGDMPGPTRRFALGLSRLDKLSLSHVDKSSRSAAAAAPLPHRAWPTAASGSSVRATAAAHRYDTHTIHHGSSTRETVPGGWIRGTDRRTRSHDPIPGERAREKNTGVDAIAYPSNNGDRSRGWTLLPPIDLGH